jgi:prevent-host-death family protein
MRLLVSSATRRSTTQKAQSIRTHGILSPLLVRPLNERSFAIVAGARRYRAAQLAGVETAHIRPATSARLTGTNRSYYSGHSDKETTMQKIAAAQFKAQCLAVMDQVSQSGRPVVITKHGKPVVKLVPATEGDDEIFGALAGIARITGDIENTVPASDWGVE